MRARQRISYSIRLNVLESHPSYRSALLVCERLNNQGYVTVFAGGCVRDAGLGVHPKDIDLATSAPPEVVERTFARTLAVGKAFGTIVVIEGQHHFEVTTFRKDGVYADGRHPTTVEFSDMEEDALRRDFTVNALFYDPQAHEILDFVGGFTDLQQRVLRTVGRPEERFREDRLRMLRGARFVAQLGFPLDESSAEFIRSDFMALTQVSKERLFNELKRLLECTYVTAGLRTLIGTCLHRMLWPELETLNLQRFSDFMPVVNWCNGVAAISLLVGAKNVEERMQSWKAPRAGIKAVLAQMENCKVLMNPATARVTRLRLLDGDHYMEILNLAAGFLPGNMEILEHWLADYLLVAGKNGKLPPPLLNGQDLLKIGIEPGQKMGQLLKVLYEEQLEGQFSSKEEALEKLQDLTPD
jgi:tRNA nucleotidyltransferase/poly(A) polymerase